MHSMTLSEPSTMSTEYWAPLWGADEAWITEMTSNSLVKKGETNSATLLPLRRGSFENWLFSFSYFFYTAKLDRFLVLFRRREKYL